MSSEDNHRHLLGSWLEFREAVEAHPEIRQLLFDPVTGFPTTPLLFPRIETLLAERGEVSLLCLNVMKYSRIEEVYGWKVFDDVMRQVAETIEAIAGVHMRDADVIAELMIAGNSFVVVLSPPRNTLRISPEDLRATARRFESRVREVLADSMEPTLYRQFGCYVGCATIDHDPNVRLERLVHEGLERALTDSCDREAADAADRARRLRDIIETEQVRTLVHPIVRLGDNSVVGYEMLSRGPENSEFERPDKLFHIAHDADLVTRLERLCRKKAFEAARLLPEGRFLFLNVEVEAVADPQLRDVTFTTLLAELGLRPENIVLEITERTAVEDFTTFRATLQYLRALGFKIAVDDAGAGYGSLQCLAEIRPEWLKIDISLVRGIHADEVRRQLLESLVTFASRVGVQLIAEGIETQAELDTLLEIGVEYGQGFLFSQPVAPFPDDCSLALGA